MNRKWFLIASAILLILFVIGIIIVRNIVGKLDFIGASGYSLVVLSILFETVCVILRIYDIAH